MKTAIFITIRMDSSRLPAKTMQEILGKSVLEHVINRAKLAKKFDEIIVCTTVRSIDDPVAEMALRLGVNVYRGSLKDKLERWNGAAREFDIDYIVTFDGDDLFCEPELLDMGAEQIMNGKYDFIEAPKGLICGSFTYAFTSEALKKVCEIKDSEDTEMMWTYFKDTGMFRTGFLEGVEEIYFSDEYRLTLDYPEDFQFFTEVFRHFACVNNDVPLRDIIAYFKENPEIAQINIGRQQEFLDNQREKTKLVLKKDKRDMTNPSKYLGNEMKYLQKVLEGESWSATGGSWTIGLEQAFSRRIGTRYGVAFNSGTSTLHAALEALGVGAGDEVISPALTVIMDSTATFHANAIPVYCDVDEKTFNMDPDKLEELITSKTKAIITVALYGLAPDYDRILDIAKRHNIPIIEDNAQAVLSYYKGRLLGTIGDISSFSFENTKHISCGEGGMILTDCEEYAVKCRKLGGHGFKNLSAEDGRVRLNQDIFQNPDYKRHDVLGWNYRMPEFTAAVAYAQLERVDELVRLRQESAKIFIDVMKECEFLIPQEASDDCINTYYSLGVRYLGKEMLGVSWQDFRKEYVDMGGDGYYGAWSVPYLEPMIADRMFAGRLPDVYKHVYYEKGLCPVAENIQKQIMQMKTNYRDLELAKRKADILYRLIKKYK